MDVPAMEATDIPTIGDMINKQKWILEAKTVEKMIEVEKDILDIKNCDNLEWLQPTGCDTLLEDMPLPLPLRDSLYAFPMNALTDLLVPQAVSILPQQPRDSLGDLMSVWFEVDKALDLFGKHNDHSPALHGNAYDPLDEDDISDPYSMLSTYCKQPHISCYMSGQKSAISNDTWDEVIKFRSTDQLYQELEDNYSEHKQIYSPIKPVRHINVSNQYSTAMDDQRAGLEVIGRSDIHSTENTMSSSRMTVSSETHSSGFPSNSKSSDYGIRNDQWTTSSTTEGSLFQNKLRKRRMTESMDCQDNETNVKNTRRKLSVLSPNLAKFSRLSDASDSSSEFSTPLSASCNTDYERADMNQMRSIISTDRPKYASNNVP
ncbi:unnamed protein product [Umbelopsis sp. WA50703]